MRLLLTRNYFVKKNMCLFPEISQQQTTYLMCKFMGHYNCHPLFISLRGHSRLVQHGGLSVCNQSPVLHSTRSEIRYCYHICNWDEKRASEMSYPALGQVKKYETIMKRLVGHICRNCGCNILNTCTYYVF